METRASVVGVVEGLTEHRRRIGRENEPFDILVAITDVTPGSVTELEDLGVTMLSTTTPALTEDGYRHVDLPTALDQMERFAESYLR